jgi:hypothetical protein
MHHGWEEDDDDYIPHPPHDNVTCKFCGKTGLHWLPVVLANGRTSYKLHTSPGNRRHKCEISTDDFDVVKE